MSEKLHERLLREQSAQIVIAKSAATKQSRADICVLRSVLLALWMLHPLMATRVRNNESRFHQD
ncbi:hypothetical protein [uncultured Rhodospira sp.]|uniref:hypothetical protein n=1 Tax=uncultured Rhodospira sp. TaxID=1936189 RepID=UPI002623BD84|nr:hypothetical protein [uncultured Rhodospira sp.]